MVDIMLSRAKVEDTELINKFFRTVLVDTFYENGISSLVDTFEAELKDKQRCLNQDFESSGKNRHFLIAKVMGNIVGTIEFGPANDLIMSCTNGELRGLMEIGTVFVLPEYQSKGIGSMMVRKILMEMDMLGYEEFCLDSGYKTAQKIWTRKFGYPQFHLKEYWGKDADHMVWRLKVKDVLL